MSTKMYDTVCDKRFTAVNADLKDLRHTFDADFKTIESTMNNDFRDLKHDEIIPMRQDVELIKEKVFNGLSHLPRKMNWLIVLFITICGGIGALIWTAASSQGKLEAMLELHTSQTETIIEQAIEDAVERQSNE